MEGEEEGGRGKEGEGGRGSGRGEGNKGEGEGRRGREGRQEGGEVIIAFCIVYTCTSNNLDTSVSHLPVHVIGNNHWTCSILLEVQAPLLEVPETLP